MPGMAKPAIMPRRGAEPGRTGRNDAEVFRFMRLIWAIDHELERVQRGADLTQADAHTHHGIEQHEAREKAMPIGQRAFDR